MRKSNVGIAPPDSENSSINVKQRRQQLGVGLIGWMIALPILLVVLVVLVILFYEGRKAYWDNRVTEMCEKDGGVKIYESLQVTNEEYDDLPMVNGVKSLRVKNLAQEDDPAYSVGEEIVIHQSKPRVWRRNTFIIRREDSKKIAKYSRYVRVGGDFPTGVVADSSYGCPDAEVINKELHKIFVIGGETR